ncbi:MAG: hypothetical protein JW991_02040 [Candidatus Pacebacteria bacterium]|nr:hypothetical protein [Candidatus Paceibacterota bacterium]
MKFTRFLISVFCLLAFSYLFPRSALAAKKRPPRGSRNTVQAASKTTSANLTTSTQGIRTKVRFRPDRLGLLVAFSGFERVSSVTYSLSYTSNGVPEGIGGTITSGPGNEERELLFATCSSGICRWHQNIQNARLVISSKLKSGITVRKPYRIKV